MGRTATQIVELDDIQGNVFRAYAFRHAAFLIVRIDDGASARGWLADNLADVTSAAPWTEGKPDFTLNLAFSYQGLRALGVPERLLATFPDEFRDGMAARAALLGDTGENAPETWEEGFANGGAHVYVRLDSHDPNMLATHLERVRSELHRLGTVVHEQLAQHLPSGKNHFGFTEGAGQVAIEGDFAPRHRGEGIPDKRDGWRPIKAGEFVLGYRDEDGELPVAPAEPLGRNGTYVVYRKYFMDVARFTNYVRDAAGRHLDGNEELVAAKIVGRWRDGTPLVLSPDKPDPAIALDPDRADDFRYDVDPIGLRCPLGAHIRRANPRDAFGFLGKMTMRHRMIRRGMSYGAPPEDPAVDDGVDRGLVFTCFLSSIARQFEVVQSTWVNDGNVFGLGDDKDFLIGPHDPNGKMTIQGDPPVFLSPQEAFVRVRGGEYFFRPGLGAIRALAEGFDG